VGNSQLLVSKNSARIFSRSSSRVHSRLSLVRGVILSSQDHSYSRATVLSGALGRCSAVQAYARQTADVCRFIRNRDLIDPRPEIFGDGQITSGTISILFTLRRPWCSRTMIVHRLR